MKKFTEESKTLGSILRHNPSEFGLQVDSQGWCDVQSIVDNTEIEYYMIEQIIREDTKKSRYEFNSDHTQVRAKQGHSLKHVEIEHELVKPSGVLYHGTSPKLANIILKEGLIPQERLHVHLSDNIKTAQSVGQRYSKKEKPVVFVISNLDAMEIFKSSNGVYLTEKVAPENLSIL